MQEKKDCFLDLRVADAVYDSSMCLMRAAENLGHQVFYYHHSDLSAWNNGAEAGCYSFSGSGEDLWQGKKEQLDISSFDLVIMRQDPPFDMQYITTLYMLEKSGVAVVNSTRGLRDFPEKVSAFMRLMPPTLISNNLSLIQDFMAEHGRSVVKPLYAFGGKGVACVEKYSRSVGSFVQLLSESCGSPVMVQKFCSEVLTRGDKRVVVLGGQILGAFARTGADD